METTDTELLQQIATLLSQPISISDIISLVLAAISVFAAIFVPYNIMEKQNKISVFEKRFQIYNELEKIYRFSESVENLKTLPGKPNPPDNEMAEANLYLWFNITNGLQFEMKNKPDDFFKYIKAIDETRHEQQVLLKTSEFLYGGNVYKFISNLNEKYDTFLKVLSQNHFSNEGKNYLTAKNDFVNFVNNNKNYSKLFKNYSKL